MRSASLAFDGLPSTASPHTTTVSTPRTGLPTAVHRARLPRRVLERIVSLLHVVRRDRIEGNAELSEDCVPLRRRRREDQRRCRRARQISSHGHFFDHSAFEW